MENLQVDVQIGDRRERGERGVLVLQNGIHKCHLDCCCRNPCHNPCSNSEASCEASSDALQMMSVEKVEQSHNLCRGRTDKRLNRFKRKGKLANCRCLEAQAARVAGDCRIGYCHSPAFSDCLLPTVCPPCQLGPVSTALSCLIIINAPYLIYPGWDRKKQLVTIHLDVRRSSSHSQCPTLDIVSPSC